MRRLLPLAALLVACGPPPDDGKSDGGVTDGGAELCTERTGGALIDFQTGGMETLRVWITDGPFIDEALRLLAAGEQRIPNFLDLVEGRDCDPQYTWHPNPAQVEFADFTIELCDGRPSCIEADKTYWLGTVDQYCPWGGTVLAVDDRR